MRIEPASAPSHFGFQTLRSAWFPRHHQEDSLSLGRRRVVLVSFRREANLRAKGVDIWAEWADEAHTKRFARKEGDLGPVYGYLWRCLFFSRQHDGVDQIARLVGEIKNNPNSRNGLS